MSACDLSPTALAIAAILKPEVRVTPWGVLHGGPCYRIWICRTSFGWFQRHEWLHPGRNETDLDPWIPTPLRSFGTATLSPPDET